MIGGIMNHKEAAAAAKSLQLCQLFVSGGQSIGVSASTSVLQMNTQDWLYAEYIIWNAGLDEAQAGIKTAGRNINNLRYADDTTLMAENEEQLKSLLVKVKEETEKAGLKLNIQKSKIMASGPITSWQIDGEAMEMKEFGGGRGSKILQIVTAAMKLKDTCSSEEKLWPT